MTARLVFPILVLLAPMPAALAQAGPPDRVCRILAEYAFLLVTYRDSWIAAPIAIADLRTAFSPDPANLPSDINAARIAEGVYDHPDLDADTLAEAVGSQCLDSLRNRG